MRTATRLTFFLLLTGAALLARPCAAAPFQWSLTGSLNTGRDYHTATLLPDGKVLVVGGLPSHPTASCELYDPATGSWSATGSLNFGRIYHTATLLANGKVLVAGGFNIFVGKILDAELYDPATGTWTLTGRIREQRYQHAASLLPDGRVLIAGGYHPEIFLKSAEIYDPATGVWTSTGSLAVTRDYITTTLLNDGEVLAVGGEDAPAGPGELYNPATGLWRLTGALHNTRVFHTANLLADGRVLVTAGSTNIGGGTKLRSAEVYDPATEVWTETGDLNFARYHHTSISLPNGLILAVGGQGDAGTQLTSAELYDPASGTWTSTGSLNIGRFYHAATLLADGMVLVEGGDSTVQGADPTAELYNPGVVAATTVSGRGSIAGQGDTATFNLRANVTGGRASGSVTFSDPAAGVSLSKAKVRTLTFNGNSADLGGNAKLGDGSKVTYSVTVTDNGDGSTDTFSISLSNGYSAGSTLTSGDILIQ